MKSFNFTTALIFAASIAASSSALAGDGLYISGGINSTTQEFNHTRNTGSNQPNTGPAGGASASVVDKDTGIGFVGGIGYKQHFANDFYVSLEAFYSTENSDTTILNNVLINQTSLDSTYGGDLRFGTDINDKISIYGLSSLTAFDIDSDLSYTFAPPVNQISNTEWAFVYGGGVEINLNDKISTFGEFRLANDISFDTPVDEGGITSVNELNYSVIRTGLRYSF
jgi:opacity protein-like surface antigen